jgi:hypothetical protein
MANLASRLIKASNLSYDINDEGTGFSLPAADYLTISTDIGFTGTPPVIFQSKNEDGIDACYFAETNDAWLLVFRGTLSPTIQLSDPNAMLRSLLDWLNDGKIEQVKGDKLPGLVHAGFLSSLDNLWEIIDHSLFLRANQSGKPLYITGHSKGGGLAFLAAQRLLAEQVTVDGVYTFAAPRAGNQTFALEYDAKYKDNTYRIEYQDDVVPHIPPQTGAWIQSIQTAQTIRGKISAILSADDVVAKASFDALVSRLQTIMKQMADHTLALDNYVSVGTLKFIDWDNNDPLQDDSWALNVKRELHLAEMFLTLQYKTIAEDHFSAAGHGYMDFQYPADL